MNASSWKKAADFIAKATPADPPVQAAATAESQNLQSLPLSALSVDDSRSPQVTYEPQQPIATSTPRATSTESPEISTEAYHQILPGMSARLYPTLVADSSLDTHVPDRHDTLHSKRLPKSAKNFGVTELELTGLLVNIHGFMQLLCNRYFEVLVDHKAIEYMIKSKTESPTMRLKTLLLKLSEYTIDLKYQKGSEMHTSDALSRLHNFTDTPDQKDIIPTLHYTPHYIKHSYSHLVKNLYAHKTKTSDATTFKESMVDHQNQSHKFPAASLEHRQLQRI